MSTTLSPGPSISSQPLAQPQSWRTPLWTLDEITRAFLSLPSLWTPGKLRNSAEKSLAQGTQGHRGQGSVGVDWNLLVTPLLLLRRLAVFGDSGLKFIPGSEYLAPGLACLRQADPLDESVEASGAEVVLLSRECPPVYIQIDKRPSRIMCPHLQKVTGCVCFSTSC